MLALLKEVWLKAKKALTTLSGVLIHFTLQKPQKAKKLVLSYLPQQDLNGYSKPWLGGNGKNYSDISAFQASSGASPSVSGNVLTLTSLTNGDYKYSYVILPSSLLGKTVTLSCDVAAGGANVPAIRIVYSNSGTTVGSAIYQDTGTGTKTATFTFANSFPSPANEIRMLCYVVFTPAQNAGATATFTNFMIEEGSTPTTYEPYSNVCAITGRNDDRTFVSGKNMLRSNKAYIEQNNTSGTWSNGTYNHLGVDFTPYYDDQGRLLRVHAQGTASGLATINVGNYDLHAGVAMTLNGAPAGGSGTKWFIKMDTTGFALYDYGSGATGTPTIYATLSAMCRVYNGNTVNFDFYPMLRPATDTDPTFAPADFLEYDSNYDTTLYGGDYDIVTAKLANYYKIVDLGDLSWSYWGAAGVFYSKLSDRVIDMSRGKCTGYELIPKQTAANLQAAEDKSFYYQWNGISGELYIKQTSFGNNATTLKNFVTGVKLVYEAKEPTITSKTAVQIDLNEGINNIATRRADTVTVVYESEE